MKKGFTLVELLIVIIIIGILATIAVPQYQKMVTRSRWSEGMHLAMAVKTGQSLWYAQNNAWASWNQLNTSGLVDLPLSASRQFYLGCNTQGLVWAASKQDTDVTNDGFAVAPNAPFFRINCANNITAWGNEAPGKLSN